MNPMEAFMKAMVAVNAIANVADKFMETVDFDHHPDGYGYLRKHNFSSPEDADLWLVGLYIAAHKFYGVDMRYQVGERTEEEMKFYYKFPNPPLKKLFGPVEEACKKTVLSCIAAVKTYALKSGSLQYIRRIEGAPVKLHEPFVSNFDMFRVRQTAAYYLCWFALRQEPAMTYTSDLSCFSYLHTVADIVPESKRQSWIKEKKIIRDERESGYKQNPYRCSELWFCPDPCYGKKTHGIKIPGNSKSNEGNPCEGLKDDTCEWMPGANTNFRDLTRNRLNNTCRCSSSKEGFKWIPQFQLCADADECYDRDFFCPSDKVCKNTVGGYRCQCQRGYKANPTTHLCEPFSVLGRDVKLLKYNPDRNRPREVGLLDEIEDFLGFSSAESVNRTNGYFLYITSFVVFAFLFRRW